MFANTITATRMAAAAAMIASSPTDPVFWILYAWCGISDTIDGPIARRLGEESPFGARLDSIADVAFAAACCLSLLPECDLAAWLVAAIIAIATAKILPYALKKKKIKDAHTKENKAAGLAVFLTLPVLFLTNLSIVALPACILATYSIIQESRTALPGKAMPAMHRRLQIGGRHEEREAKRFENQSENRYGISS